jgi:hypothetical protein
MRLNTAHPTPRPTARATKRSAPAPRPIHNHFLDFLGVGTGFSAQRGVFSLYAEAPVPAPMTAGAIWP